MPRHISNEILFNHGFFTKTRTKNVTITKIIMYSIYTLSTVFNKIVFLIISIKNIRKNTYTYLYNICKNNQKYEKNKNGRQGKIYPLNK